MNSRKMPPPPKPRVLIVFGRMRDSAIDRAAWFDLATANGARLAAGKFGLKCLAVTTDEHREAAMTLPEGILNPHGQFRLPAAQPDVIEKLEAFMAAQCQATAMAPPAAADDPSGEVSSETPESAGSTPEPTDAPAGPASQPPANPSPTPTAPANPSPTAPWENLKVGATVLGATYDEDGEFAGWWEAKVVGISGNDFQLRWLGYPDEPMTQHERRYLALLHPDYLREL